MKNTKLKLWIILVLAILLISGPLTGTVSAVNIYIEGQEIASDVDPEIRGNRTFVPLRVISEDLGERVDWDGNKRMVSLVNGDREMEIMIGDTLIKVFANSNLQESFNIESAPYIKQNRTMVPIRAISEFFGKEVNWDGGTRSVYVGKIPASNRKAQGKDSLKKLAGQIPRIKQWIPNYDRDVQILPTDVGYSRIIEARLNEVLAGNYSVYQVSDKTNPETGFSAFLFIDKNTNHAYYSNFSGIFSLPDNRLIHAMDTFNALRGVHEDDQFVTGDGIIEVLRALAMQEGLVKGEDDLEAFAHLAGDHVVFTLWRKNGEIMDYVIDYMVKDEAIYKASNHQKLYSFDEFKNRKEIAINEGNCGQELMKILVALKIEPENMKYHITDISYIPYSEFSNVDRREGYQLSVRGDGSDPNVTFAHHYFINTTGTVVMRYDVAMDIFYYVYGEYVPYG